VTTSRLNPIPFVRDGECRHCRRAVQPPKMNWCSKACITAALIRKGDAGVVRRELRKRDKGICARCGVDARYDGWEADHIMPVSEGGGGCDLDGYRTLCIPCHKIETAQLAARRARARRIGVR
jgi:5-methylcytosine-specific restriction endonuclease McrA